MIILFNPVGGASGDMILASLLHLGCPVEHVQKALNALDLGPYTLEVSAKEVHGIACRHVDFIFAGNVQHRHYADIRRIISGSKLDDAVKSRALQVFQLLAEAEAAIHQVAVDDVHFHEIGALDSIFDIVGICAALAWFQPAAIYCTPLPLGGGITNSNHGPIPVPAPATMRLIEGLPVRFTSRESELVTPTAAAVIKSFVYSNMIPDLIPQCSGYGCGDRSFADWSNLFRVIKAQLPSENDTVMAIETDVDDMIPEEWEAALTAIRAAGALDAKLIPCIMKQGRPGTGLHVLAKIADLQAVMDTVLVHTSSIGVRYYPVSRMILDRRESHIDSRFGQVRIKEVTDPRGRTRRKPEYRDLQRIAHEQGMTIAELRGIIFSEMNDTSYDESES